MATIKKDISISSITITKKRYKFTGLNFDSESNTININYDIWGLNASDVEIFKYGQITVTIPQSRFGETAIANFLSAGQTVIINEAPNS